MIDVEFDEPMSVNFSQETKLKKAKQTRLTCLAIKLGVAKDEHSANLLFAIVAVVSFLAAVFVFTYFVIGYNPFSVKPKTIPSRFSPLGLPSRVNTQNQIILK